MSVKTICRLLGYTPQAYHKHQSKTLRLHVQEGMILEKIQQVRRHQPRCGGRKLFVELQAFFEERNIKMGRDAFFDLLRRNKLLVRKLKRNVYTTMSKHHFRRYPNLVKDFTPFKAHEMWVADITYIPTQNRHAYLFLITDAYSRKIVGFHLSDDMKVSSGIMALKKALAQKPADAIVVHHSDRGIQYCSTEYTQLLEKNNCMISMTQNSDPYENAIAERVNGILKTELISSYYADVSEASKHISRCITIYNYRRRHSSLGWQVPEVVHKQSGVQKKTWKNYYYKREKKQEQNEANTQKNPALAVKATQDFSHA